MTATAGVLHVRERGVPDGVPVVLLHSLFFDGSMFDGLIEHIERVRPAHYHFVAPDHRGQGLSPDGGAQGIGLDLESLADDAADVITSRCDTPVHLVGSSMGGYVGTHLAARHPELVRSCTLLGGTADAELDPGYFASLETALRSRDPDVVDRIEHTMFGDDFVRRPADDPVRARWRGHFAGIPPRVADAAHAVFTRAALHDSFDAVRTPVLLVAGEQDHAKPPGQMTAMAHRHPGADLVVLDGTGHTPVVECPARVARLLLDFWASTARPLVPSRKE